MIMWKNYLRKIVNATRERYLTTPATMQECIEDACKAYARRVIKDLVRITVVIALLVTLLCAFLLLS